MSEAAGLRDILRFAESYDEDDHPHASSALIDLIRAALAREPDPAPPSDLRAAHEAWHGPGCSGQCEVMRFIAALPAPTPEAAGLREALVEAYRALDRAVLLAREPDPAPPSDAGLRELADEIAKDWNGRPDVCPRCGHSSIGCFASQATPEAAGLREAVEKFLRRWDDPERYHPIPAVDDLRAALAAPEAAGLRDPETLRGILEDGIKGLGGTQRTDLARALDDLVHAALTGSTATTTPEATDAD